MDVNPPDLPDHNQLVGASRAYHVCAGSFTREQLRADLGWEPTERGWRCRACSRRRWGLAARAADLLIAHAVLRWTILRAIGAQELQRLQSAWDSGFSLPSDVSARIPSQAGSRFWG
jgi:hypothetical protein